MILIDRATCFFDNFKHANSYIRNVLFHKYCTACYGSQVLPMFGDCMQELYTAWRIAVCREWRVPWTTHYVLYREAIHYLDMYGLFHGGDSS